MSQKHAPGSAPLNPDYGNGIYRRSISLRSETGDCVMALLEDDQHAFSVRLLHDGGNVTAVSAVAHRYPLTTCAAATGALAAAVGAPLSVAIANLKLHISHRKNCTHLFDLTALAISHAARGEVRRRYDITIPDADDERTDAVLECNGKRVLVLALEAGRITSPAAYAGRFLLRGFSTWANAALGGEELEFALLLQRGYYVAGARRYDMRGQDVAPAAEHPMPPGVCYSYTPGVVEHAYTIPGNTRDFTTVPEQLLRWVGAPPQGS